MHRFTQRVLEIIDWFVPEEAKHERSEHGVARNFVFTHLLGPALAQSMCLYLFLSSGDHTNEKWILIGSIWSFWTMPFLLKFTRNLRLVALLSFQILTFASLYGTYHYGGVASPFLPWLIVALLLGFFYLSESTLLVVTLFFGNLGVFVLAISFWGLHSDIPAQDLQLLGWASILSATIYVAWWAAYYSSIVSSRSETEREAQRHRETAIRLRTAKDMAEKASTAKSIFLAKMSHELRTPLNAVIGYSELLLEDAEMLGKGQQTITDLRRINVAGKHLLSLVDEVLDLSKIESSTMDMSATRFDVRAFVDEVISNVEPLVERNGNRLAVVTGDNLGEMVTDQTKLRQAAVNLLSNAAKFTKQGVVTFSVRRDSKVGGDWVELRVQDTGIGISDVDLAKLFQNFEQGASSTSSRFGGTGLGLALSQRLCAMMGGAITVKSQLNRGSTFTIRVPADITALTLGDEAPAADLVAREYRSEQLQPAS